MRAAFSAALFVAVVVARAPALDVSLNGARRVRLAPQEILSGARTVAVAGTWLRGVLLEDVLPVMTEVHALDISTSSGTRRVEGAELAERLGEVLLEPGAGSFRLLLPLDLSPAAVEGVEAIDVAGTPLERRTLEVWASWEGVRELKGTVGAYAALHGLEIKVTDVPDPRAKLLTVLRGGGSVADVVMVQSDYIPELVGIRALQPLDALRTVDLVASGWAAFTTRDGRRWAAPFFRDTQLVFYNPTLVSDPPALWTLDDLERLVAPLAGRELLPMAWNAYSAYWLVPFQVGFGKDALVEDTGGMVVDDEPTARAIRYLLDLRDRGLLTVLERDAMIGLFGAGKVGVILSGSYSIPEFRRVGLPFRVAAFPRAPEGRQLSPLLDYKGFAVTRTTRNPLLARRLVQYLARPDVQLEFATAVEKLPASEAATEAYVRASRYGAVLIDSLGAATLIPPEPAYAVYKDAMWQLLRLVFSGEMNVEEALGIAQQAVDTTLKELGGMR